MSKKNFIGGLDSLLGEQPTKPTRQRFEEEIQEPQGKTKRNRYEGTVDELAEKVISSSPKRGRPTTQFKEITKSSQEGTKENETRATFIVNEALLEKLKAVAYWERKLIKVIINSALEEYVEKYEKKNGAIKPIK